MVERSARKRFTRVEDRKMVKYFLEQLKAGNEAAFQPKGNALWDYAAELDVTGHGHTSQSMLSHFKRHLFGNLLDSDLLNEEERYYLKHQCKANYFKKIIKVNIKRGNDAVRFGNCGNKLKGGRLPVCLIGSTSAAGCSKEVSSGTTQLRSQHRQDTLGVDTVDCNIDYSTAEETGNDEQLEQDINDDGLKSIGNYQPPPARRSVKEALSDNAYLCQLVISAVISGDLPNNEIEPSISFIDSVKRMVNGKSDKEAQRIVNAICEADHLLTVTRQFGIDADVFKAPSIEATGCC